MIQAVSSLASVALSLNCKHVSSQESKSFWLILNHRDNKFRCRACFPSNAKFPFRRRYVERRQSILCLRRYAIVVGSVPVQNIQIEYI